MAANACHMGCALHEQQACHVRIPNLHTGEPAIHAGCTVMIANHCSTHYDASKDLLGFSPLPGYVLSQSPAVCLAFVQPILPMITTAKIKPTTDGWNSCRVILGPALVELLNVEFRCLLQCIALQRCDSAVLCDCLFDLRSNGFMSITS